MYTSLVTALLAASVGSARTITVKNNCKDTIWPAMFTQDPAQAPKHPTGWAQQPGQVVSFAVPDVWKAARIWGRTHCNADGTGCKSGDCGGLECTPGVTGKPPASLAEFTLQTSDGPDNYDISLVDGFNLPVSITPSRGDCPAPKCVKDLNPGCPAELKPKDGSDGCLSQCQVDALAGHPDNNPNCCSGIHDKPETCPKSGVKYYEYFKNGCRDAYAYAYDEKSESALWTCDGSKGLSDYTVEFCPS